MKIFNLASVKYVERMNIAEPSRLIAECIAGNEDAKETLIWEALNNLDDRHRMVVVLRYFHELSITEISEILSINERE